MPVLEDLLAWSADTPPAWVKDALRRIVTQRDVTVADIDSLTELCKKPFGLATTGIVAAPLAAGHLPTAVQSGAAALRSLTHVSDVNALAPGETITFSKNGLTVVYGDNGAGKTGYARILKRACRARGSSEPVLPNAHSEHAAGTPTAKLKLDIAGTESEHFWKDGTPSSPELGAISVFDSSAAQVYVADKTEVRFRPFGLDVLDKLAVVCGQVKARLDQERVALESHPTSWPLIPENTEVARLLGGLTALTPPSEVTRLATLSEQDERNLKMLEEVLAAAKADDPVKRAADFRLKASRIKSLSKELATISDQLGNDAVQGLATSRREADQADANARELAKTFAGAARLPGFGSPVWRQLWDAAHAYSQDAAYSDREFPFLGEAAACVMCQQELGDEAKDRFQKFGEFVRNDAQQAARTKTASVNDKVKALRQIDFENVRRDARDDLVTLDTELSEAVEAFLKETLRCRDLLLDPKAAPIPLNPNQAPTVDLELLASGLETRATELNLAADPVKRQETERRCAELRARHILKTIQSTVLAEISRKARINAYVNCAKDTNTNGLTRLSTDLTKKYVTDVLTTGFNAELKKLGFTTPELELRAVGAQRGLLYHQVQLKHVTRAELPKVVSEGEARCIALAAFLAELQSAGHASGIVFDDPVSSLDHRWRTRVANRLVGLAKDRQVVVFTHELVFLHALMHAATPVGIECTTQSVWRRPTTCGHVDSDLPWAALSTQKRLAWIRNEWQRAEKVYRVQGERDYHPIATLLYARLRQTWERAVEEVLLCGVVERFRSGVETQRLRRLDIQPTDLDAVDAGMTKCSRWEGGHDQALAANDPPPKPDELQADISELDTWLKTIDSRRKKKT